MEDIAVEAEMLAIEEPVVTEVDTEEQK